MSSQHISMDLLCPRCDHNERCNITQMLARLQQAGTLRRTKDPEPHLVAELFAAAADRFRCTDCGKVGLAAREAADDNWDEWDALRQCQDCGQAIPKERVDVFPNVKLCATCQQKDEAGGTDEADYCPRCGDVMATRLDSRGTSRYVMACPSCGAKT